jgi:hypothetical protein
MADETAIVAKVSRRPAATGSFQQRFIGFLQKSIGQPGGREAEQETILEASAGGAQHGFS